MQITKKKKRKSVATIVGILLCLLLVPILVMNVYVIIYGHYHPEKPPSLFGVTPMIVQSGSMNEGEQADIEPGDLILIQHLNQKQANQLKKKQVITFKEEGKYVTHRIVEIKEDQEGKPLYVTKGDANQVEDELLVAPKQILGVYTTRFPYLGDVAMFLQSPFGLLISLGVPITCLLMYDFIQKIRWRKKQPVSY